MFAVGMLGSYITQGVYTVAGPFHPFGGAVDIIVVEQEDGTFKSSPWYVKFGKFQGVLKRREKTVDISVNDVPTDFHMYLDNKGEAYFEKEAEPDEDTMLSPPSAPSSGDEMGEHGRTKFLLNLQAQEGLEMQEARVKDGSIKATGISADGYSSNSGMTEDIGVEQVDSDSTVWVSDALVNEDRSEVVIAISETNSYLVEGKLGNANGTKLMLKKEENSPQGPGKEVPKPSRSIFGLVFGRKTQQVSGIPSPSKHRGNEIAADDLKSRLSLERAEIVADLLDRRWGTGEKEILLTPTTVGQITSSAIPSGSEGPQLSEMGTVMHGSECARVFTDEACQQLSGQGASAECLGRPILGESGSENAGVDDMQISTLRLETKTQNTEQTVDTVSDDNVLEEDWFSRTAVEEQSLVLLFQETMGDERPSSDCFYGAIYEAGAQLNRCIETQAASEKAVPSGTLVEDANQSTECGTNPEVVLMSVDGHIITAPVSFESFRPNANEPSHSSDRGGNYLGMVSCNGGLEVASNSEFTGPEAAISHSQLGAATCSGIFPYEEDILCLSPGNLGEDQQPSVNMEARSETVTRGRSKPIVVPQGESDRRTHLTSSASLPARLHDTEKSNYGLLYSRSARSDSFSTPQVQFDADDANISGKDGDGNLGLDDGSGVLDKSQQPFVNMEARSQTFSRDRSKPIAVPQGESDKRIDLPSSASLPARWHDAGTSNYGHLYSRSAGSDPLSTPSVQQFDADATYISGKDVDGNLSLDDRQTIEAIVYRTGKNFAQIEQALDAGESSSVDVELSLCRHMLSEGMGAEAAARAFAGQKVSFEEFQRSASAIVADENLVVKVGERYFSWVEAVPYIHGMVTFGSEVMKGGIAVESIDFTKNTESETVAMVSSPTRWNLWPFSFRKSRVERGPLSASAVSNEAFLAATNAAIKNPFTEQILQKNGYYKRPRKSKERTYTPTSAQLASLKLKDGPNKVTFTFSTRVLGQTQVDARIYLWKWNTRIVVSDVDGTITRSDVLGQVMPLVGKDWSQSGVTRLFSAIKDNGYELLFLSARAISQAYLTRQFLLNLKQDGEALPDGPVFISPDGLIPSLYREVIRRAPHEFKISCLERIRELFPSDINPFYAGFGNRDTDEISYLKVGIPKGKIFIINPKGEVAVNHQVDVKSYSSLHTLVDDMFPAMSSREQEDFNSWNYWKLPLPDIDDDLKANSSRGTKKGGDLKR